MEPRIEFSKQWMAGELPKAFVAAAPGETIDFNPSLNGGTLLLTLGAISITRSLTAFPHTLH